jgi:drug/metabolite transporter (DMT)-like permease
MSELSVRPALWMLVGALAFAAMGACTHALGDRCDWLLVALIRAVFMLASAALLARAAGVRLAVWNPPTLWMRSLAGSFSLVCNFYALARLPISDAITLSNAYPLWISLGTAVFERQWPTRGEILSVLSGLAGVVLIQRPLLAGDHFAVLASLLGSVSTAVALVGLHRLRSVDPRAIMAHFAGVAVLTALGGLLIRRDLVMGVSLDRTTGLILLGVGVTGTIGQYFLTKAYAAGPPGEVAVIGLTQVIFALVFDVVLWNHALPVETLAGFGLVLAPAGWLTARMRRRLAAPSPADLADPEAL